MNGEEYCPTVLFNSLIIAACKRESLQRYFTSGNIVSFTTLLRDILAFPGGHAAFLMFRFYLIIKIQPLNYHNSDYNKMLELYTFPSKMIGFRSLFSLSYLRYYQYRISICIMCSDSVESF